MRKILIIAVLFCFFSVAKARPLSEEVTICLTFNGNTVVSKGSCVVGSGYGAGGSYTNIEFNKKKYLIEEYHNPDGSEDSVFGKFKSAFFYRDLYLNPVEYESIKDEEIIYLCYRQVGSRNRFNICYKGWN